VYLIVWEFRVKKGREREFEKVYAAGGDWARLFSAAQGFLGVELASDAGEAGRYVTLDRWSSRRAYEEFRRSALPQYEALDRRCEDFTEQENHFGSFEVADPVEP
jgi:heme-degrading monooxygenase HmoA